MQQYKVSGMTCGHCAQRVTKAVEKLPAVERAVVDVAQGELSVEGEADEEAVRAAVSEAGYSFEGPTSPGA